MRIKKMTDQILRQACLTALTGVVLNVQPVLADEAAAPQAAQKSAPSLANVLSASGIDVHGFIDTSYTYLSGAGVFTSGVPDRVFDTQRNSFNLQMLGLTVSRLPADGFGALVNLNLGPDANVIAPYGTGSNDEFDVTQAYLQYASGPFAIMAGKFVTLAGAEVINSPDDLNFSRSILFGYAIPYTHTGIRGSYAPNDMLKFTLGLNNGWDDLKDTNTKKTVEAGVSVTPVKAFSVAAQYYGGVEQISNLPTPSAEAGTRHLLDVVATYNPIDPLTLVLNYDYGSQKNAPLLNGAGTTVGTGTAKWSGLAGYVNYKFTDQWGVTVRGEVFDDKDGYRTGLAQKWKEATATVAYMPTKHVVIRAEARTDHSDQASFVYPDGSARTSQHSYALEAIYKF